MDIKLTYQPTPKELAKASSLFIEKKPFLMFTVGLINVVAWLLFGVMILKLVMMGLNPKEWLATLGGALWLFGRRPFNEWLLLQRMNHSKVLDKPISIEISRNGIIWSGKGLVSGNMTWNDVKYVLCAKNGLIIPNSGTKFLWLPFRAFQSETEIEELKAYILQQKKVYRTFPKWEC